MDNNQQQLTTPILGMILAGGQSSRMGCDKAFCVVGHKSLLVHAITRLTKQMTDVAINTNRHNVDYKKFRLPLVADNEQYQKMGPLSGIASSLHYAKKMGFNAIITVAIDTPFFPLNLVEKLSMTAQQKPCIPLLIQSQNGLQPTFALWPVTILPKLHDYINNNYNKSIRQFAKEVNAHHVFFDDCDGKLFFNINNPQDLETANHLFQRL